LSYEAAERGAELISFHELSVTGYSFIRNISHQELLRLAEPVPDGPATDALIQLARDTNMCVMAGLLEKERDNVYNTQICVDRYGVMAKHRKLHGFIHKQLKSGNSYTTFQFEGWKCGILTCYDNNVIENVRANALMGVQILFAPHVAGCTPSTRPGSGYVDKALWERRKLDPIPIRMEFDGPKAREWFMRWLPARAYDNGIYIVFSNPIGMDDDQVKSGGSMIIDPFGDVLEEIRSFDNTFAISTIIPEKLELAGGHRYRNARRPELYRDILSADHKSVTRPVWMERNE